MKTFNIYRKKAGIHWSTTFIVYTIFFLGLLSIYIKTNILEIERNSFETIVFTIIAVAFVYGIAMKIYGLVRIGPLNGKLRDTLILDDDCISIGSKIYHLNDIKKIGITNLDYYGAFISRSRSSFESSLSHGVGNAIVITLNTDEHINCKFQQINEDEMMDAKDILLNYHQKGKIHFIQLMDALNITDYNDIQEFKKKYMHTDIN